MPPPEDLETMRHAEQWIGYLTALQMSLSRQRNAAGPIQVHAVQNMLRRAVGNYDRWRTHNGYPTISVPM